MKHRIRGFLIASLSALAMPAATALAHCGEGGPGLWHAPPGFAADFAAPMGLLGVWRAGSGEVIAPETEVPVTDLACPPGVVCLVNNPGDRRSIKDFERYTKDGDLVYALAFTGVERPEALLTYIPSGAALETELQAQLQLGFHLADFETFYDGGTRRWAALFQGGGADQQVDFDMSATELENRVEGTPPHGVLPHLVDFELLNFSFGLQRYAALFDSASIAQQFFPNLSVEEFHETVHDLRLDGFYLADVETWVAPMSGEIRFAAVFEESSGDDHLYVMACARNHFECDDPSSIELMNAHLTSRTVKLPDDNPSVRLIDIEYPRSNEETDVGSFGAGLGTPAVRQRRGSGMFLLDPPIFQVPPTCTHAGVLHDAGTNGPP